MRVEFRIGEVEFHGVSFEQFDDFPAFSEKWAQKMVPGRALLASWDHVSHSWSRPVGPRKLRIAPGIQCLRLDGFGQRDRFAEAASLTRILTGLGVELPALKSAISEAVPPSQFTFDASRAVPADARQRQSWQVLGEARFDHFVLRFPVGRVDDWAILSVATDFVLSRRRVGQTLPVVEQQVTPKANGTLAERVFDMMSGTRRPRSMGRPN